MLNRLTEFTLIVVASIAFFATPGPLKGDENGRASAVAPANTEVFETVFEGTWFVDKDLNRRFREAEAKVEQLESEVRTGKHDKENAVIAIADAKMQLKTLRKEVDAQKTLVSPFEIETKTVEEKIELGPERLLIVTADRIRIVGWHEPHAKIVLVKKVLSSGLAVDEHLAGIEVTQEHRVAPEMVGQSAEERAADLEEFKNSDDGKKLTPEQLASNVNWRKRKAQAYRDYAVFQGKKANLLTIRGLTAREGNRHISYRVTTPNGNGQVGSRWRRHAELTLFVPKCTAILLRGCEVGTDISGVEGQLILTSSGSRDRDYSGKFSISEHRGPVTLLNVPMDAIEHILGDIRIESTIEMVNNGTNYARGMRTSYTPRPRKCVISDVTGNLTARFTRSDLHLSEMLGTINVRNDFGDTRCTISSPLDTGNHRIVTQSGSIYVKVAANVSPGQSVYLATSCGTAATNLDRDKMEASQSSGGDSDGTQRSWRSFSTAKRSSNPYRFGLVGRAGVVLNDTQRTEGLDLVSVAGRVEFIHEAE